MQNILIVDDRQENLLVLETILSQLPEVGVVKALSGRDALWSLLRYEFALVILDVQMPEMDGFETAALIRSNNKTREIPIIFISAVSTDEKFIFKGYEIGAVDYLVKPINDAILKNKVNAFLKIDRQRQSIKEQSEQLSKANEYLEKEIRIIFEQAPIGIAIMEPTTGRFVKINQTFCDILGYSYEETLTLTCFDVTHPDDLEQFLLGLKRLSSGEIPVLSMEKQCTRKDSKIVWANFKCIPLQMGASQLSLNLVIVEDITDKKRLTEELQLINTNLQEMVTEEIRKRQQQEQMLIQQSKMAAMGEMIGLIAHQWRQPLNVIGLIVQELRDTYGLGELDEKQMEMAVASTMSQVNFMSATIEDFRNFFKPSKKKSQLNVKIIIEELLSMFEQIFKQSNISVSIRTGQDTILSTRGYPNEFKQVILNILNNSKDAITSKRGAYPKTHGLIEITIGNNAERDKIMVSIRDNGNGIPEQVMERIFEPYYTTKGKEGTGIGLYMSKTIIETNMGGILTVKNVEGGAEFMISLEISDIL
ncbi:MAG: response regulator [Nitrospirae bacterium]|nr:response regulator [Nitrospirota bacterium]